MKNLASSDPLHNPETSDAPVTRVGKIARLPRALRIELNHRLADGEVSKSLLDWLNGRPETEAVLAAEFGGRPVNEQNLSEWRRGGFVDWQRHEEMRSWVQTLEDEDGDLFEAAEVLELEEQVATLTLMNLGRVLRAPFSPETREHGQFLLGVLREVTRMRQVAAASERASIERERWEFQQAKAKHELKLETMRAETANHHLERILAPGDQPKEQAAEADRAAEEAPKAAAGPAKINGNQGPSSQIEPGPTAAWPQPERARGARDASTCLRPDQGKSRSPLEPTMAEGTC